MAARCPALSHTRTLRCRRVVDPFGRVLGNHEARGQLRIGPPAVVNANRQAPVARDGRRLVGGVIDEIGHLHLPGANGEAHRGRGEQQKRADEGSAEHEELPRTKNAGSQGHEYMIVLHQAFGFRLLALAHSLGSPSV